MHMTLSKALVTGGAGFIGSHLVEALVKSGCAVTVLDNLSSGHLTNLISVKDKIRFVQGDIQDQAILTETTRGCEVVFHQAAVVSVTKTVEDPVTSGSINDLGTLQVLEAARRNKVRRVVLASSSAVYGDDPRLPKTESMPPKPMSPYAVQKLTNEYYAQLYYRLYGMETVCLRYFNVFGPRQDPSSPYSGVISKFMTHAAVARRPIIYGDGCQTRDFVYVQDVVGANLQAAQHEAASGQVFNVGTNAAIDINTLWKLICQLAQCQVTPDYGDARAGDIVHSLADIQKANEKMGFKPSIAFEEGLRQTFAWYKQSA